MALGHHHRQQPVLSSGKGVRPGVQQHRAWMGANPTGPSRLCPVVLAPPELGLAHGGILSIYVLLALGGLRKEVAERQQIFIGHHIGNSDWRVLFPASGSWCVCWGWGERYPYLLHQTGATSLPQIRNSFHTSE